MRLWILGAHICIANCQPVDYDRYSSIILASPASHRLLQWGRWKCEAWNNGKGNNGTKIHQNAGVETARNGHNGTKLQGVENARHEHSGKAKYGKPLIVKYV